MVDEHSEKNKGTAARPPGSEASEAESGPETDIREELEEKIRALSQNNRQLKRKIFDLYTIFEISRNFNAVLEYQNLLDTFVFTCLGQVGALKGAIFLKQELRAQQYYAVKCKGSGALPSPDDYFSEDSALVQFLLRLNRPVPVPEVSGELAVPLEAATLEKFANGVIVPLVFQNRLVGLFLLAEKISSGAFTNDDIEFLSVLGNQIAVAIENARLYEAERDVSKQLQSAQHQLVQTERLAALGEMSAKIAHEVNNPLGIIKNYVMLCRKTGDDPERIEEYTDIVSQEIDRIAGIVAQMREFQRPTRQPLKPLNVEAVLENTLRLTERQLSSSGIELIREFDPGPHFIRGIPDSLKQVFLNLIMNARSEMDSGGKLIVGMHVDGETLRLTFRDTGPGIPPDIIPRIFEPFFTTKGDSGTGLGLSVCYGIIKSHHGSISFTNVDGGGLFEIQLPLMQMSTEHESQS